MLVLSRRSGERIIINQDVELVVIEVRGERVKLGFNAPPDVPIHRAELHRHTSPGAPAALEAE